MPKPAQAETPRPRFSIPGPLGDYLIHTKLNRGGMADVYLAQPLGARDPGSWLALKTLLPRLYDKPRYIEMFTSEGELGLMLQHPNIARTVAVAQVERRGGAVPLLAMEYVHGRDLGAVARHFRRDRARMPIPQALYIIEGVLRGLDYAHTLHDPSGTPLHLVNRDISPPNVMIGFDGHVRVIDFGIAQATLDFRSQIGAIKGKISYMSPEQVRGLPVDARSDLFSLMVVLYQLITGVEPFAGDSEFAQMEQVRRAEVQPPSQLNRQIGPELEALLLRGLAREADDRYDSARAMLEALRPIRDAQPVRYGALELSSFMGTAFDGDLQLLRSRIRKARALMRQIIHSGAAVWGHEMGERAVAHLLPTIQAQLRQQPLLGGAPIPEQGPPTARPQPAPTSPPPEAASESPPAEAPEPTPTPEPAPPEPAPPPKPEPAPATSPAGPPPWALPMLAALGVVIVILLIVLGVRMMR